MQVSLGLKLQIGATDRDGSHWYTCRAMEAGGGGDHPESDTQGPVPSCGGPRTPEEDRSERDRGLDVVFPSCPTKSS